MRELRYATCLCSSAVTNKDLAAFSTLNYMHHVKFLFTLDYQSN